MTLKQNLLQYGRVILGIVLALSLAPFIYGAGWAVINVGVMSYLGSKDSLALESLKKLNSNPKTSTQHHTKFKELPLVKKSFKITVIILGLIIPLAMGTLFGVFCREWYLAVIPYTISLFLKLNPFIGFDELWLFGRISGLTCGLVLLLVSSWIFSKIRFVK